MSFYNPTDMEAAIAAFCRKSGQPVPADRGAYLRCVYESLAMKYRMVNRQICNVCGKESKVVHIVGGGCKNGLLNRCTADALGMPVLAGPEEATAVGNFMTQELGLGIIGSMQDAQPLIRKAFGIKELKPGDTAPWDKAYERFCAVCAG